MACVHFLSSKIIPPYCTLCTGFKETYHIVLAKITCGMITRGKITSEILPMERLPVKGLPMERFPVKGLPMERLPVEWGT